MHRYTQTLQMVRKGKWTNEEDKVNFYSGFHVTLPRGVAKLVVKFGTRLQTSQLRCEVRNVIGNLKTKFATLFPPKYITVLYKMMETLTTQGKLLLIEARHKIKTLYETLQL